MNFVQSLSICQVKYNQLRSLIRRRRESQREKYISRIRTFETLEARHVLAAAIWNNVGNPRNADGDAAGFVSPIDALVIINELNGPRYSDPATGRLPRDVSVPANKFFDVNCDGFVSPSDVLPIVNELNAGGGGIGGMNGTGKFPNLACSPQLSEATAFVSELQQTLTLPDDSSAVKVWFRAPEFDFGSRQSIRDAFEIEITDLAGNPVTLPYVAGRDAVYNWSESLGPLFGPATQTTTDAMGVEDSSAMINLAGLPGGTQVRVTARLVNNDTDQGTQVILRGFEILDATTPAPTGAPGAVARFAEVAPVDLQRLNDVTGSLRPSYGRTSLSGNNTDLHTELVITNLGSQTVASRLIVAIDNISELEASVLHPDGILRDSRPFWDLTHELDGGSLEPGESLRSRPIDFRNQSGQRFSYKLSTYAELNLAPSKFTSTPVGTIEAGKIYRYLAQATDPEGQPLTYSILSGPESMTIDATRGAVTWLTDNKSVGNHRITLRAQDPYGLSVDQTFDLAVVTGLANRPPNFVSDPVTEAIASSGFEITTVATGDSPSGVAVVSGFQGPRLVTANAGEQTIGVYAGENNDRFDDVTTYSTGESRPTDSLFDVGYGIDVGLPEFVTAQDENAVIGLDQADFNGDGILDLVALSWYRRYPVDGGSSETRFQITRVLGDGNGQFGEPLLLGDIPLSSASVPLVHNLVVSDINNDGHADVLALRRPTGNPPESELLVVTGHGDGTFAPMTRTVLDIPLHDFRIVDLDQDGNVDLIGRRSSAGPSPLDLNWKRGNGDGTFGNAIQIDSNEGSNNFRIDRPYDVADLDGDGDLDVVVATVGGLGTLRIYLNDGDQQFALVNSLAASSSDSGLYIVHVADFTGDSIPDIFTGGLGSAATLYIGDGSGANFIREERGEAFGRPGNLAGNDSPVDIDGDGDLDILLGSYEPWFPVLANDGQGNFELNAYPIADVPGQRNVFGHEWNDAVGILAGDYNSDGVMDVAYMTSRQGNSPVLSMDFDFVGIALGTRPGEFGNSGTVPFEGGEFSGLSGDFNGDGFPDLLALDYRTTFLGNGDGTFSDGIPAVQKNYARPSFGYVADFNQDGLDDFLSTQGGGAFFVALSNGNGTFEISDDQIAGGFYGYYGFRVADFNQDGYPDFLAKGFGEARKVYVYMNDADDPGRFDNSFAVDIDSEGINVSGFLHAYVPGDFNDDGHMDFAAVNGDNNGGEPMRIEIYAGDSTGQFTLLHQFEPYNESFVVSNGLSYGGSIYSGDLDAGDLNGDGHLDIVSFTYNGPLVMLGRGDGSFEITDYYVPDGRISGRERHGFIADVDEDGNLDLINVMEGTETVNTYLHIYLGLGDGTFGSEQRFAMPADVANPLNFADFDGDGHLDLFHSFKSSGRSYQGQSIAPLWAGARDGLVDVLAIDLNGDGNEEVLAVNENNDRLKLFVGDNLGNLTRQRDLLTGRAPKAVTTADLDGDGQLELITANRADRSVTVFSGDLEQGYTGVDYAVPGATIDVAAADIDGDGNVDVVVLDDANNSLWVFSGNGTNTLDTPTAIPLGDTPKRLELADATGDGSIDAVITLPDSNRVMILSGIGFQPVNPPVYVDLASSPDDVKIIDLNDDGHPDLAVTLPEGNTLSVHYGRGNNQFAKAQLINVGASPTRVAATDADEDGRMDLVVTNSGDSTASVIYNRFDPNEVYRYDADAIDPDDDPLTYSIVDGPGGLIINETTGALLWAASPDQVGVHDVSLSADDGRGGIATQSFKIEVEAARENASPLIATEPASKIGAGESFTYNIDAIDNDRDTIRYRLVDGPDGVQLDPTTGELTWDGRQDMAMRFDYGSSAISTGGIVVPADESFKTSSVTVEGWFNFHKLLGLNQFNVLFYLISTPANGKAAYQLRLLGNQLSVWRSIGPALNVSFNAEIDKWVHLAMVIDDDRELIQVFANGRLLGERVLDIPLEHDPAGNFFIAQQANTTIIDNFRVWNVPRTQTEIIEGMSRQYDGDSRVVVDYRFDLPDTQTVRDFSPAGNDGYRGYSSLYPELVPGLAEVGSHQFTVAVEDGRGGYDEQSFTLEIVPELRGSIVGHLFEDLNGNGVQDDGSEEGVPAEASLEGWHLFIDTNYNAYPDPDELQTVTDADGNYRIGNLLPGEYPVRVSPVAGYDVPTVPVDVTVEADMETAHDLAIEQLSLSQIRGQLRTEDDSPIAYWKTFADLDGDGTRDDNEPMAVSDRSGNYALTGLAAGTYTIRAAVPAGWSDAAGRDGLQVTLGADEVSTGSDFTLKPTNTSVTAGIHFVTMPSTAIEARETFRYAAVAMGIIDEAITYDISLAPDGMTIDPETGLVAWRPTIDQVGEHLVILRATSQSGSIALHDFYLQVTTPNTAPVIRGIGFQPVESSVQPQSAYAYVDRIYSYQVIAQDAEQHALTFALTQAPAGATIDSLTGQIDWTPAASSVASQSFTVEVTDELGATSQRTWTVTVTSTTPDAFPLDVTLPRGTATVATEYLCRIVAYDGLGRMVTWSVDTAPSGLTVSSTGAISWRPSASQLGEQNIVFTATTADGATDSVSFNIAVIGRSLNSAPQIASQSVTSVALGQAFNYDVQVVDNDRDILAFTLLEAPIGMSVHPSLGFIHWEPASDQLGEHDVVVQVSDPFGDTTEQNFTLKVSRFGGPPRIASIPPTEASVGTAFLYSISAIDREGDPLSYTLLTAPNGMSIVETTGELVWTPAADQLGEHDVAIQVSDGIGGAATQAFVVLVSAGAVNRPPAITSIAPRMTAVGASYMYHLTANDPESTTINFSLGRGPVGMTVDGETGEVTWTPSADQAGKHVVTFIATDAGGASAIESFELDVLAANQTPVITSTAPSETVAGAQFMYDVLARDADSDPLQFEFTTAPAGATIDSFGRIRWTPTMAQLGEHDFLIQVRDPRGGEAKQSFSVVVIEDTVAPKLSLIVRPTRLFVWSDQPYTLYAKAIDNVAIASLTLTANGEEIPLSPSGTAQFYAEQWGLERIVATAIATDTNGNITERTITFGFSLPANLEGVDPAEIPTAEITTPTQDAAVVGMVTIEGTAEHARFEKYTLSYRRADQDTYTEFYQSSTSVSNGELAVWDTSLLANDHYYIKLDVQTEVGVINTTEVSVGLAGELKLGNFRLSFTDMVIPVAGIPIEITRIYDTLYADRQGDFGYGWRLEYRNTDLRVSLPKSGLEDIGIHTPFRPGVKVYLNIPGEGRQGFTFTPEIRVLPGFGNNNLVLARPVFTPDPGVTSTLSTGANGYLFMNEYGELSASGGIPYNPASPDFGGAYVLRTSEGASYRIDGITGNMISASDRNGNVLRFTTTGITYGEQVTSVNFVRDLAGRITEILDSDGSAIQYQYSPSGQLVRVVDREGLETEFTYLGQVEQYLDEILGPLGKTGTRASYDEQGRLVRVIDLQGNAIEFASDPNNLVQTITDEIGNQLIVEYDNSGNVISQIDQNGDVTRKAYDASNNLVSETDPLGRVTSYTYDPQNNRTSETDALGNRTVLSYADAFRGLPTSITDSLGNTTEYVYDSAGNLTRTTKSDGFESTATFDARGNVTSLVSPVSGRTEASYNNKGLTSSATDASGNITNYEYDGNGELLSYSWQQEIAGQLETLRETYDRDRNGRLIRRTDALGGAIEISYNERGQLSSQIDELGRTTQFTYNVRGLLQEIVYPDYTPEDLTDNPRVYFEYDALGRPIKKTDELLRSTTFQYDATGRLLRQIFPDDTPDNMSDNPSLRFLYDAAGQLLEYTDENGNHHEQEYDLNGNLLVYRDPMGNITTYQYDSVGRLTTEINALGFATLTSYDDVSRSISTVLPNGMRATNFFNVAGQIAVSIAPNGAQTVFDYDAMGNLAS
ncbi:MAG: VCBS repeat-containing protein, partial [Planctomycetales bacterium]|nr:VCBS repeat-containing protein [Planctomycetales bacterium]